MPQTYHVAAVTVANGGDNIGIYIPLFANSSAIELIVILVIFLVMLGLWCWLAFYLARHPAVAPPLTRYGSILVPYILIGLGLFILIENGSYHLLLSWKALLGSGHAAIL
jgi:cadmium resistance protein CadD (predicted permease)